MNLVSVAFNDFAVSFDGTAGSVAGIGDPDSAGVTYININVPAASSPGQITAVLTATGDSNVNVPFSFNYLVPANFVQMAFPTRGPTQGGTAVQVVISSFAEVTLADVTCTFGSAGARVTDVKCLTGGSMCTLKLEAPAQSLVGSKLVTIIPNGDASNTATSN